MVRLRLLALFQGLLCLTAASPAQKRSVQDDDYALVRDVARQFFSDRGSTVDRKAQEKEELSIDQNVREYKNPMVDVGQEDDNSGDSFPVVEDKLTPDTVEKIGEDFLPFEFPFKAKEPETSKLSFEPEEKKTGNLLPAEEENVAPDIDLVDGEVSDYNDTICGLDELGRELFVMSILMRRISGMFLDEILKAERNESAPAEEEIREDVPKNAGVLVKEEELPTVNKDRVADEIGSPKEESMPESGERKPVDDLTKLKSEAGDIGSSDAEAEELDEARERALKLDRI